MQEVLSRLLTELRNAWRFRWRALLIGWLVALGGWFYVYSLPNEYQASAKVHVDTTSVLRPLLSGLAVQPDLNQAVNLLTRTVLSRTNLEQIARKSNLDLGGLTQAQKDRLLNTLKDSIHLRNSGMDLYTIDYANPKPDVAMTVVQEVLNIMMADALGTTTQSSTAAQKFLNEQVAAYADKLNKAEQKLAEFKRKNIGFLPSESGNYFGQLQSAQQKLEQLRNQLAIALSQEQALRRQTKSMIRPENDPLIQGLNQRILDDEQKLSSLLTQYTSQYPGVLAMKERIRLEKKQRDELVAKFMKNKNNAYIPSSPIYQDLFQQLNQKEVDVQALRTQISQTQSLIQKLKSGAGTMTEVEAQLGELTRSYQVTQKKYNELLNRLYTAQLSQSAQESGNPLKFQVIDPPVKPVLPVGPKRHRMAFLVLVAAFFAGGAFAYLSAMLKPVFMTRAEITEMLALPVIGAVSFASSAAYAARQRRGVVLFGVGGLVLLLAGLLAVVYANQGAELIRVKLLGGTL